MSELKVNLDLMNVLIKLREAQSIFGIESYKVASKSESDYEDIIKEFEDGMYHCFNAAKEIIDESLMHSVYEIVPNRKGGVL